MDILTEIIETMEVYLDLVGKECSYNQKSINEFKIISSNYLQKVKNSKDKEVFTELTIDFIKELNTLNETCDYELIETDQRELICSMIDDCAKEHNFIFEEDITEKNRQW